MPNEPTTLPLHVSPSDPAPFGETAESFARFPVEIQQRLLHAEQDSSKRAGAADIRHMADCVRLVGVAQSAQRKSQRVIWLRRAAQAFNLAHLAHSACRRGCSHCCHTSVVITQTEAMIIGDLIGRKSERIQSTIEPKLLGNYSSPCPFLLDNACEIHSHRPIVCRTHLAMTEDDLLCRLIDNQSVPVPYANAQMITFSLALASGPNEVVADIREWFPTDGSPRSA